MKKSRTIRKSKPPLFEDEGMWLLNALPHERIKKRYRALSENFTERVMKGAVRINSGGSASFVSPDGLIITNHHVAYKHLAALSTAERDLVKNGFYAARREDELKIPHLEINVLDSITDVTAHIIKKTGKVRSAEIARIETDAKKKSGLRSDVVSLYQGGRYHLYQYRRYTDIRLVFAPEAAIAHLGGDIDNYEYPRYCLDITFLRAYENGDPVTPSSFFKFSLEQPQEGELLIVAGHPGRTDRLSTFEAIVDMRDRALPYRLNSIRRLEVCFDQYAGQSRENARQIEREVAQVKNLRKRYMGQLAALQDPEFMHRVEARDTALKKAVRSDSALRRNIGDPWTQIQSAVRFFAEDAEEFDVFENMIGMGGHYETPHPMKSFWTTYLAIARTIVRMADEDTKKNNQRLTEFADARRESLLEALYAPDPIYTEVEIVKLANAFSILVECYAGDRLVEKILAGKSPALRARELVMATKLGSTEYRKRLVRGGTQAIRSSKDPMIQLARLIDARARAVRSRVEKKVKSVFDAAYAKITDAQFSVYGEELYPDATFTLRAAFGTPQKLAVEGVVHPHCTTLAGTLAHARAHEEKGLWELPPSWQKARQWLSTASAPFNFISTHDSHGGNSGSPVITPDFKFKGILFDGIMSGQGSTFLYGDYERAISVSATGIVAVLEHIYQARGLVTELTQ